MPIKCCFTCLPHKVLWRWVVSIGRVNYIYHFIYFTRYLDINLNEYFLEQSDKILI